MKIAAVNFALRRIASEQEFFDHLREILISITADWVVLPELCSLELLASKPIMNPEAEPAWLANFYDDIEALFVETANLKGFSIVGGSHFRMAEGQITNVAPVVLPTGQVQRQTKNKLTSYERDIWRIAAGKSLTPPHTGVATLVCYDCEFPEAGRALAEAGTYVLAVPAFTETRRGFQRVRWSCHARAIENQCFVAHASLVGSLGREPVPETVGTSAIIAPSIEPFPESAVLAETPFGIESVAIADVDFNELLTARKAGDVRNWDDRRPDCWIVS